ncbi:MAG: bifunctional glycosyltransferase/CDP-glycerol:glycerophosphate glycerophosphotransferase [Catenisphaera adipataccumulans]|jgi:CDP-glycerol glycerophosphotransferase|uniref:bifunctional glycosyltransferase/CDP-glycerol:glycerophosphate glycerophosphotransferase n=1 Tax=Catenisphaera adipataccumulans TaxID=700500 RepID=UPI003D92482C
MKPKISIVIPYSQYPNYLKECLTSLNESTYQDEEVLLVTDHVTEELPALREGIKVIDSHGSGVAAARNTGIEAASGEYIYFMDADDYVLNNTLEKLWQAADGQDLVYGIVNNTWNNKANFLEKKAKKEEEQEDIEEKEERRQERIAQYQSTLPEDANLEQEMAIYFLLRNRKGIRNFTVLGNLYKKSFLDRYNIRFCEDFRYYSDMTFMCPVLEHVESAVQVQDAIYVKRKHNDPINYPALRQEDSDDRFEERLKAVAYTRTLLNPEGHVRYFLDMKLIHYFTNVMTKRIRRSEDDKWRNEYFNMLIPYVEDTQPAVLDALGRQNTRLVRALLKGDINGVQKAIRWKFGKKKLKSMLHNRNTAYKLAYYHSYLKKDIQPKVILFETFMAKNYSDSPKYIFEYIAKNYPEYTCVWAINDGYKVPYGAKTVRRFSFQYAYYLAVAKYLVFNVRPPLWYRKREGQVFLETWHGTPLKRLVFDQAEVTSASPKYKQQFYKQRQDWDFLVSANPFSTKTFRSCFMYEGRMLEYGYPRNDILYAPNKEEIAARIRKQLKIPADKKTILYAPTWRDDEVIAKGQYGFELALNLETMRRELSDDYVILLRTHHYVAEHIDITGYEDFVYNVCDYDDISELYLISDICITDYSSVFFDYANLKRPILFYVYDFDKYKNQLRGFYIDMETEVPGPLLYTTEEVADAVKHIDEINEQYHDRYEEFYNRFCCYDDGHASEHVAKALLGKE